MFDILLLHQLITKTIQLIPSTRPLTLQTQHSQTCDLMNTQSQVNIVYINQIVSLQVIYSSLGHNGLQILVSSHKQLHISSGYKTLSDMTSIIQRFLLFNITCSMTQPFLCRSHFNDYSFFNPRSHSGMLHQMLGYWEVIAKFGRHEWVIIFHKAIY